MKPGPGRLPAMPLSRAAAISTTSPSANIVCCTKAPAVLSTNLPAYGRLSRCCIRWSQRRGGNARSAAAQDRLRQHFDEWHAPYSDGLPESNARRAERFVRDVKAIDGSTNARLTFPAQVSRCHNGAVAFTTAPQWRKSYRRKLLAGPHVTRLRLTRLLGLARLPWHLACSESG